MKISKHCYAIQGLYFVPPWSVNSGFVAGNDKTLIIDTGCNSISAQTIYGYAKCANPNNRLIVINTEHHLDHIGGNSFFKNKEIDIYGHHLLKRDKSEIESWKKFFNNHIENTKRKNAHEEEIMYIGTDVENPNKQINSDTEIDLGGISAKIILTPGHTNTNLSVYISNDKVLYTGDTIVNKFIPNLEEGQTREWNDWLDSLNRLKKLLPDIIVPGHGEYLKSQSDIWNEFERIEKIISDAIQNHKPPTYS